MGGDKEQGDGPEEGDEDKYIFQLFTKPRPFHPPARPLQSSWRQRAPMAWASAYYGKWSPWALARKSCSFFREVELKDGRPLSDYSAQSGDAAEVRIKDRGGASERVGATEHGAMKAGFDGLLLSNVRIKFATIKRQFSPCQH